MSALSSCLVDAKSASKPDRDAYARHCGDSNRLRNYCKRYKSAGAVKQAAMKALRDECGKRRGPITIQEFGEATARLIKRPRGERMARRDAVDLQTAGLAVRRDGTIEFCGTSAADYAKIRIIYRQETQTDKNVRPKTAQTRRYVPMSAESVAKTLLQYAPPLKQVRCRLPAASLAGIDLDALDLELTPPLLSPPPAPTSLSKEKILKKGPSPALPATKAPEECPTGACSSLLPTHAVRRVMRELRRAARRSAACEKRGGGHVGSAGTPPTEDFACLGRSFSSSSSAAISPSSPSSAEMPTSFADAVAQMRHVSPVAAPLAASPTVTDEVTDDGTVPDEQLLSSASLLATESLPPMFRTRHRRTLRLMALTRLREGKPAWESEEEAQAVQPARERLSEAEAHGFRAVNRAKPSERIFAMPERLAVTPPPDDDVPADLLWLREQLGGVPDLSRVWFRPEVRGRFARAHWRAAVAKLIAQPRSFVTAVGPYLLSSLRAFAAGEGHDNRHATLYTVRRGWDVRLARFAQVEERMPNWIAAYGGHDQLM